MSDIKIIVLGFVLLLIGAALPFVMVIRLVEPTLLLNFLAAISSIGGLVVGFIGTAMYTRSGRRDRD